VKTLDDDPITKALKIFSVFLTICSLIAIAAFISQPFTIQGVIALLVGLFLLLIAVAVVSTDITCAWCGSKKVLLVKEKKGSPFWRYSNKDGSKDKRRKENVQLCAHTSVVECTRCQAVTEIKHQATEKPSINAQVWKRTCLKDGDCKRTFKDWVGEQGETAESNKKEKK